MAEAAFVIFLVDRFFRNSNCVILSLIVAGLLLGINYDCLNGFTSIELLNSINNAFYIVFSWSNNFIIKAVPYMGIGYLLFVKKDKLIYNNWILYCSLFTLLFVNIYLYCAKVLLSEGIWQNV